MHKCMCEQLTGRNSAHKTAGTPTCCRGSGCMQTSIGIRPVALLVRTVQDQLYFYQMEHLSSMPRSIMGAMKATMSTGMLSAYWRVFTSKKTKCEPLTMASWC